MKKDDRVQRIAKGFHLIGLALFLGSILGHAVMSAVPGAATDARTTLIVRQAIEVATIYLTLPGLGLLVASGLVLAVRGGYGFGRVRWLTLHQLLAIVILINAALILLPVGDELLAAAGRWASGGMPTEFRSVAAREAIAGGVNILLAVVTVFVAVIQPRLGKGV